MDYKDNDKKPQVNSSSPLDDIDEFFLKNFNILLDDKKEKEETKEESVEILDFDNQVEENKDEHDVLDFDEQTEEKREETDVLDFDDLDDNNSEKIEILNDLETNNNENINLNPNLNIFFGLNTSEPEKVEIIDDIDLNNNIPINNPINNVEILDINEESLNNKFILKEDTLNNLSENIEIPDDFELKSIEPIMNSNNQSTPIQNYEEISDSSSDDDSKEKTIKNKNNQKPLLVGLLVIILVCLGFVIYKIVNWKIDNDHINEQIKDVQENVVIEEIEDNENTVIIEPTTPEEILPDNDYYNFINVPLMNVDLNNLKEKNGDTVGWLKVNGTNINYPVVQTTNNDYYINHSFDESYNDGGWIFADYRNNLVDDKNLIIYGHARLNSTMFGTLKNVTKSSWYTNSENHLIKLSTINSNTSWQVFSTYIIDNESYYIKTDFSNDSEYLSFLNTIKNRSVYNYGVPVGASDRILTLSTCYLDNKRVVLHAKLIKMENR